MYKRRDQNSFLVAAATPKKFSDEEETEGEKREKERDSTKEKESLRRKKGLCHRVSFFREETNGRRRKWSSRKGMQRGDRMNGRRSVARHHAHHIDASSRPCQL